MAHLHEDWVSSISMSYIPVRLLLVYSHGTQTHLFFQTLSNCLMAIAFLSLISDNSWVQDVQVQEAPITSVCVHREPRTRFGSFPQPHLDRNRYIFVSLNSRLSPPSTSIPFDHTACHITSSLHESSPSASGNHHPRADQVAPTSDLASTSDSIKRCDTASEVGQMRRKFQAPTTALNSYTASASKVDSILGRTNEQTHSGGSHLMVSTSERYKYTRTSFIHSFLSTDLVLVPAPLSFIFNFVF